MFGFTISFKTYLKLDILNHYNRVPNIPDTVMEMKRRALQERLHELEKLAHDFPQTNEVKIALLRAYHLLGERPESLAPGFIETVSTDKPQEMDPGFGVPNRADFLYNQIEHFFP